MHFTNTIETEVQQVKGNEQPPVFEYGSLPHPDDLTLEQLAEQLHAFGDSRPDTHQEKVRESAWAPGTIERFFVPVTTGEIHLIALDPSVEQPDLRDMLLTAGLADLALKPQILDRAGVQTLGQFDPAAIVEEQPRTWIETLWTEGTSIQETTNGLTFWQCDPDHFSHVRSYPFGLIVTGPIDQYQTGEISPNLSFPKEGNTVTSPFGQRGIEGDFADYTQVSDVEQQPFIPELPPILETKQVHIYQLQLVRREDGELDVLTDQGKSVPWRSDAERMLVTSHLITQRSARIETTEPASVAHYNLIGNLDELKLTGKTAVELLAVFEEMEHEWVEYQETTEQTIASEIELDSATRHAELDSGSGDDHPSLNSDSSQLLGQVQPEGAVVENQIEKKVSTHYPLKLVRDRETKEFDIVFFDGNVWQSWHFPKDEMKQQVIQELLAGKAASEITTENSTQKYTLKGSVADAEQEHGVEIDCEALITVVEVPVAIEEDSSASDSNDNDVSDSDADSSDSYDSSNDGEEVVKTIFIQKPLLEQALNVTVITSVTNQSTQGIRSLPADQAGFESLILNEEARSLSQIRFGDDKAFDTQTTARPVQIPNQVRNDDSLIAINPFHSTIAKGRVPENQQVGSLHPSHTSSEERIVDDQKTAHPSMRMTTEELLLLTEHRTLNQKDALLFTQRTPPVTELSSVNTMPTIPLIDSEVIATRHTELSPVLTHLFTNVRETTISDPVHTAQRDRDEQYIQPITTVPVAVSPTIQSTDTSPKLHTVAESVIVPALDLTESEQPFHEDVQVTDGKSSEIAIDPPKPPEPDVLRLEVPSVSESAVIEQRSSEHAGAQQENETQESTVTEKQVQTREIGTINNVREKRSQSRANATSDTKTVSRTETNAAIQATKVDTRISQPAATKKHVQTATQRNAEVLVAEDEQHATQEVIARTANQSQRQEDRRARQQAGFAMTQNNERSVSKQKKGMAVRRTRTEKVSEYLAVETKFETENTAKAVIQNIIAGKQRRSDHAGQTLDVITTFEGVGKIIPPNIRPLEKTLESLVVVPLTVAVHDDHVVFETHSGSIADKIMFAQRVERLNGALTNSGQYHFALAA